MPHPIPYIIGVIKDAEQAEALDCQVGDEYAVFKGGKEARGFVCDMHMGKPVGVNAKLLKCLKEAYEMHKDDPGVEPEEGETGNALQHWIDAIAEAEGSASQS